VTAAPSCVNAILFWNEVIMIVSTLRIEVAERNADEVEKTLLSLAGPTSAEPGCLKCYLYRGLDNSQTFGLFQEWNSELQLRHYLKSDWYKMILAIIDLAVEPPEISFYESRSRKGMEVIKKARSWS
jgi:quinol monooxygenase YgiN